MTPALRAALLAAITCCLLLPAGAGATDHGGGVTLGAADAPPATPAAPPAADAARLETRTVTLTSRQLRSVQRRIKARADGRLGPATRSALRRFQKRKGLAVTGRPNVQTLRALGLKLADKLAARAAAASADGTQAEGTGSAAAIAAARRAIGTPYRTAGTSTAGFDCSGLVQWAFARAGVELPRTSFQQYREGTRVARDEIRAGDLVFFDTAGPGASHVGIAVSATAVISATSSGVKEHSFGSGYWRSHHVGARRL